MIRTQEILSSALRVTSLINFSQPHRRRRTSTSTSTSIRMPAGRSSACGTIGRLRDDADACRTIGRLRDDWTPVGRSSRRRLIVPQAFNRPAGVRPGRYPQARRARYIFLRPRSGRTKLQEKNDFASRYIFLRPRSGRKNARNKRFCKPLCCFAAKKCKKQTILQAVTFFCGRS